MDSTQRVFRRRLISTLVLWAIVLGTVLSGYEQFFFATIAGIGLLGLWEYYEMLDRRGVPNFKLTAIICGVVFFAGSFYAFRSYGPDKSYDFEIAVLLGFLLVVFGRQMFQRTRDRNPLETMAYTLFGLLYIVWLFNFLTKIVYLTPRGPMGQTTGQYYVLYLLLVTKFSDMGAYLAGSLFGRHKLVPHISPHKSWEGLAGAIVLATAGSFGLWLLIPERLSVFSATDVAVLGVLLGAAAVIGDLAESIVKRSTEAKDSGGLLPGIGGVLDLIDSVLFTAPLLFFYMRIVLGLPQS
ncbi:MAG: phosphatidate cytidylyltransferase [Chthoniobacterales bacterium]|jgi:phosphatidate cytidylyltransferase|nr:phosphatidate cytidylyltransferase [Chthoniobacterales bacterium]